MRSRYELKEPNLVVLVPKELDHHYAGIMREEVEDMLQIYPVKNLIFDFRETEFMDSSGIGVLIGRSRELGFRNGTVYAKNLSRRVEKIFRASGLYKIIQVMSEEVNV